MLPEYTREELATGTDKVVRDILDIARIESPPVDAFFVARQLEIIVATDDLQAGRGRFVRRKGRSRATSQATILIRSDERVERLHWAVAHEVGESMAPRIFAAWGIDPREASPTVREEAANHLAGRLLLPTHWFARAAVESGWDLPDLKARFATASHELIARQMLEFLPPVIITIVDQGRIHFRRSNVPGRVPPLSPAETQCWRSVHEHNRPDQTYDGLRKIQGWPVHEELWQREILRTEVDAEPDC
jgi:hypothetical protein